MRTSLCELIFRILYSYACGFVSGPLASGFCSFSAPQRGVSFHVIKVGFDGLVARAPSVEGTRVPGPSVEGTRVPGPSVEGTKVPGPSVEGTRVPGPSVEGTRVPGPSVEGTRVPRPSVEETRVPGPLVEGTSPPPAISKVGQFCSPNFACVFRTRKAVGSFYLVYMPGEVKDPTQGKRKNLSWTQCVSQSW